ncbi:MAG: glycosyltransferase [Acidobacteria bacterium]|nr:glycosyltransferase [Acidobacteriota bacterium]
MDFMKSAVFTIVAKNYLAHARSLMASIQRFAPAVERFVVLVDEPEGLFDPAAEPFEVIRYEDLPIPKSRWFCFKYTVLELSTAVKPYAAELLLEEMGIEKLIYFDPDILLYRSLDSLLAELDTANALLTPHLTQELSDGCRPDELDILRAGTYNLGFIAMRRGPETLRMLRWWQSRLYDRCVVSPNEGLFVDQRWMDLVPGLFEGIRIIRDEGWNVAYWNVHGRPVEITDDGIVAAGRPLLFFHFSGYDPRRPDVFSKHQDRFLLRDLGDVAQVVADYGEGLLSQGLTTTAEWPYTWARFADGMMIPDLGRPILNEAPALLDRIEDPFSEEGKEAFLAFWNQWVHDPAAGVLPLTKLALRIYSVRSDVQAAMPDVRGADCHRFGEWFVSNGVLEHRLADELALPMREQAKNRPAAVVSDSSIWRAEPDWLLGLLESLPGLRRRLSSQLGTAQFLAEDRLSDVIFYLSEEDQIDETNDLRLPRIAGLILERRKDVAAYCSLEGDVDPARFLTWLLSYGRREYQLPRQLVSPIRRRWKGILAERGFGEAISLRGKAVALSAAAWWALPAKGASNGAGSLERHAPVRDAGRPPSSAARIDREERECGVNLVGYTRAEMGVGESVRLAHQALAASGVPVAVRGISTNGVYSETDARLGDDDSLPYLFDLLHVNADQFPLAVRDALGDSHDPRLTIGYWAWELEEFPESFDGAFALCGEIWTPSEFCRRAIAERSPHPVLTVPHPLDPSRFASPDRTNLGLPSNRFVFLTMVDMLSVCERKNPLAAIRAFRRASANMPDAELVVKVNNGRHDPAALAALREAAAGGAVRILDETLPRKAVDALIASADCFVSLHRAEGFGLGMAEAMAHGKPVIATGYSGNMDFMDPDTAFLVRHELTEVPAGCGPYRKGALWASADLSDAARWMRVVYGEAETRERVARAGRDRVLEQLAPERVGEIMRTRLEILNRRRRAASPVPVVPSLKPEPVGR